MYAPDGSGRLKPARPMQSYRFISSSNRFYSGGGGLCSTASQLDDGVQRLPGFQFGLGFRIDKDGIYSWGGAAGTRFWIDPKNKLIAIYMVQINPTSQFDFGGEMKKLVYASME